VVVKSDHFKRFIIASVLVNSLVLILKWYTQPPLSAFVMERLNDLFTFIFVVEAFMSIVAQPKLYFQNPWNRFDFIIAIMAVIGIGSNIELLKDFNWFAGFIQVFMIFRLLKLMKHFDRLKSVLNTFIISLPPLTNVGCLLVLILYFYSILGIEWFAKVKYNGLMDSYINFRHFDTSFVLMFILMTGDAWNEIMVSFF